MIAYRSQQRPSVVGHGRARSAGRRRPKARRTCLRGRFFAWKPNAVSGSARVLTHVRVAATCARGNVRPVELCARGTHSSLAPRPPGLRTRAQAGRQGGGRERRTERLHGCCPTHAAAQAGWPPARFIGAYSGRLQRPQRAHRLERLVTAAAVVIGGGVAAGAGRPVVRGRLRRPQALILVQALEHLRARGRGASQPQPIPPRDMLWVWSTQDGACAQHVPCGSVRLCGATQRLPHCPPKAGRRAEAGAAWRERAALPPSFPGRMQTQGECSWAAAMTRCIHAMASPVPCSQGPKRSFASTLTFMPGRNRARSTEWSSCATQRLCELDQGGRRAPGGAPAASVPGAARACAASS